jgi:hypothetical protein
LATEPQGSGRGCVFCGGKPLTGEHVIPEWIGPYLEHPAGHGMHRRINVIDGRFETTSQWQNAPATVEVKCVCQPCNGGWMSNLENEVRPFMVSILKGHQREFFAGGLTALSTWAVKTTLIAAAQVKPDIPGSFYEAFYMARVPSRGMKIWLGAVDNPYSIYIDHRPLRVAVDATSKPPDALNGYVTTLGVGHLALYVFAREGDEPPVQDFIGEFRHTLTRIWPVSGPVKWPPTKALTSKGLDALAGLTGNLAPGDS